jgi:anthranilate/para-aminobenzoate synthase component I
VIDRILAASDPQREFKETENKPIPLLTHHAKIEVAVKSAMLFDN